MGTVTRERGKGNAERWGRGRGRWGPTWRGLGLWNQVLPEGWSWLHPSGSVSGTEPDSPAVSSEVTWALSVCSPSKLFPLSPPCYGASCHLKRVQRSINRAGVATVHVSVAYYPTE